MSNKLTFPLVSLITVLLFVFVNTAVEAAPVFRTSADDPTPLTEIAFPVYYQGDYQSDSRDTSYQGGTSIFPYDANGDEITLRSLSFSLTGPVSVSEIRIGTFSIEKITEDSTSLLVSEVPPDAPVGTHKGVVTATSDRGTATLWVTIIVKARPRFEVKDRVPNQVFTRDEAINPIITLPEAIWDGTGKVTSYTLTPRLPDGLSFKAKSRTLSGTPTAVFPKATFTYTAKNPDPNLTLVNKDASLTFTITVEEEASTPTPPSSGGGGQTPQPTDPPQQPPQPTNPPQQPRQNNAPVFAEGAATKRSISENADSGTNIGTAVSATDADNDTLTYTLGGTDAASFSIVSTSGQLQTKAALDYETKTSYTVTVSVSDGKGGTDSITVTINVTDVDDSQPSQPTDPPKQQPRQNSAPVFTEGAATKRSISENADSGTNIGTAVSATDADNDTLTYTLGGTDAASFSIVSTSGQLQTKAALDYETKTSYSVTVSVSDGNEGTDSITVTINVTNANEAPSFTDGSSTTRSIAENTASGQNIGAVVAATDEDNDTLTYTLGGTDAASFSIVSTSGQLQTKAALDYETKTSYSVEVSVSDSNEGTDSITVTINVTDVNEAPSFTDGSSTTRSVAENTASGQNIGTAVAATDEDNDTLTYTLGGTDAASFSIVSTSGQLQTKAALDYETKKFYSVKVSVSDGNEGTDSITVTISVTDVTKDDPLQNSAPVFTEGAATTRSISENVDSGTNIGTAVSATDADNDTLTYTLGGTDAASFGIVSTSGQLQTKAALDYETKTSYAVTVSVSDGNAGIDSITVTIKVTDAAEDDPPQPRQNSAPVFTEGVATTRSISENVDSGTNIGTAVSATDADNDTLTYTLGGTDAASFSIVSTSGQLQTRTALDYETKSSYSVTVSVSDGNEGTDSITVTINVTNVNEAPSFTDGSRTTRSVAENTASGQNIGTAVAATDEDNDTLTYTLGGTDAASFSIVSTSGQLQTKAPLDYETKSSYSVTVSASDGSLTDSITVTINVTDVNEVPPTPPANNAPVFTDGTSTTRSIAENTASGTNIGTAVAATDADNDTLTYTLGGTDAASFSIVSTSGQLQTKAALDYETKTSYTVTVSVSDGSLTDSITVTINVTDVNEVPPTPPANNAPVFTDGTSTTRSIAENTASGTNIGTAVAATDADNDTLTYTLGGTDAASFSIVSTSGQLQTKTALDYETKTSYSVTVSVSDGNAGTDSITVTINVTNVNEAPSFTDGSSTTRSVAENTASGQNIGTAVAATDEDNDTLTYTLGGTDAASFSIVSTSGQLQTKAPLDYETKSSYSVTVSASDGSLTDSITVTINVTDVNEVPPTPNTAPVFAQGVSISNISATVGMLITPRTLPAAVDADGDTITYALTPTLPAGLTFNATTRLLSGTPTAAASGTVYTYTASDGKGGSASLSFTIVVNAAPTPPANNAPVFTDGTSTTRSIAENTASGTNIGTAVAATDADNDTLTYTLGGTDAASFSIVSTSGQLQTKAALDYETKTSYAVTVSVSDGNAGTDSITVTINVTDVDDSQPPQPTGRGGGARRGTVTRTKVPYTPIIINEIGNNTGNAHDWVELRNVTNTEVDLEKWELTQIVSKNSETTLVAFLGGKGEHTIPAQGVLLLVGSDPFEDTEHPLAAGIKINKDTSLARREKKTGTASRYYVDARLQLSDTEPTLLVLRDAENKKRTSENIVDLTGTLYIEDASMNFQTQLWPLQGTEAGSDDVLRSLDEAFVAGKVYQRRRRSTGTAEHTWVQRWYTGVGYKRIAKKVAANGGTPGFPNDAVKKQTAELLEGATVRISEIMYTPGRSMPQWIELYNSAATQAINLKDWQLQFENAAGADVRNITLTLDNIIIPPNQPLLLVSTKTDRHSGHFPSSRILDLWGTYRNELKVANVGRRYMLLSPNAFRLTLREKGGGVVDVAGNLGDDGQALWALPIAEEGRSSILRVYDKATGPRDGTLGVAGTAKTYGWVLAADRAELAPQQLYYGHPDDKGSPGYRIGGALPVALSLFRPQRVHSGAVVLKWVTESELNNAGFNILRCETREGDFKQVNASLIVGQGTTSQRTAYTWTDLTAKPDVFYYYRIEEVSLAGKRLTLTTARLTGHISAAGKLTTQWGALKKTLH